MKIHEILVEALSDKLELLHDKWKKLIGEYKYLDVHMDADIWNELVKTDPTKNKQYLQWIITKGISKWKSENARIFLEDLPKIHTDLERFHLLKMKNKLRSEHKDINKINSDYELWEVLQEYKDIDDESNRDKAKALEKQFFDKGEAKLIVNNNEWKIVVPLTVEASCFFGINTRWCTAAKNHNMFYSYDDEGRLYIILHKPTNERWQFHLESASLMDELDHAVDFRHFHKKYPEVFDKFIVIDKETATDAIRNNAWCIEYIKHPTEEMQLMAVKSESSTIGVIDNPTEKVQELAIEDDWTNLQRIKNQSERIQMIAIERNSAAISLVDDPTEKMQLIAVKHNGYLIRYILNPSEEVQLAAVKNTLIALQYIENPTETVQMAAVKANTYAITNIKRPTERVKKFVLDRDARLTNFVNSLPSN